MAVIDELCPLFGLNYDGGHLVFAIVCDDVGQNYKVPFLNFFERQGRVT